MAGASLANIRSALAANLETLRTAGVVGQISAYLLDNPTTPSVQIAGLVADGIDYDAGGYTDPPAVAYRISVEAVLGAVSDTASQDILNQLLAVTGTTSLRAAVEANQTLTSRYTETTRTVTTGQSALADYVHVTRYRGQSRHTFPNGSEMLLAAWEVLVQT